MLVVLYVSVKISVFVAACVVVVVVAVPGKHSKSFHVTL